jgi:GNAT superfamily N-acetyltransferase
VRRAPVTVRSVSVDDLPALRPLWDEFCALATASSMSAAPQEVLHRVSIALSESAAATAAGLRPSYRLLMASIDDEVVGFVSLSVVGHGLLTDSAAVVVDAVHVTDQHRKRGIGTALLREAVVLADEVGAGDVVVNTPTRGRDVNRFYARQGFAPLVVRRSAPVASLRRRLGVEPRLDLRDTTIDLSPVQRTLRRRAVLTRRPVRP